MKTRKINKKYKVNLYNITPNRVTVTEHDTEYEISEFLRNMMRQYDASERSREFTEQMFDFSIYDYETSRYNEENVRNRRSSTHKSTLEKAEMIASVADVLALIDKLADVDYINITKLAKGGIVVKQNKRRFLEIYVMNNRVDVYIVDDSNDLLERFDCIEHKFFANYKMKNRYSYNAKQFATVIENITR